MTVTFDETERRGGAEVELDPRTKILLVVATSIVIMAPGGGTFVPAALCLGVLLACTEHAWTRAVGVPLAAAVAVGIAYVLPHAVVHPAVGVLGTVGAYLLRLIALWGVAAHLVSTTSPTALTAALRVARIPRALTVTTAVMLRFIPTIVTEARAVYDAMRLRGLGGRLGMLRHPIRSVEYFTVPLIASTLRVAEDLSAAALLRGLGSHTTPTTMHPPRFGRADVVAGLLVVVLVAATWGWRVTR
ncbi:energy-coupling factor transporter transmembrane component T [Rhodococcus sp. NPDC058521]|uniref:energy-coupling factor transporter transmembrane component T n=1 Tax=Rhodococcus sp. NPDC058521 TaxID=3346536 RepID=UPI0036613C60